MDTKDYTVTMHAGPKVAGIATKPGATLKLTEAQASAERLAGAIVPAGKGADADPLAGSARLAGIQARAQGLDRAGDEPAEEPSQSLAPSAEAPASPPPKASKASDAKSPQA